MGEVARTGDLSLDNCSVVKLVISGVFCSRCMETERPNATDGARDLLMDVARTGNLSIQNCNDITLEINGVLCSRCKQTEVTELPSVSERQQNQQNDQITLKAPLLDAAGHDVLKRVIANTMEEGHCVMRRTFVGRCMERLPPELQGLGAADRMLVRSRLEQRLFKIRESVRAARRRQALKEFGNNRTDEDDDRSITVLKTPGSEQQFGELRLRFVAQIENVPPQG